MMRTLSCERSILSHHILHFPLQAEDVPALSQDREQDTAGPSTRAATSSEADPTSRPAQDVPQLPTSNLTASPSRSQPSSQPSTPAGIRSVVGMSFLETASRTLSVVGERVTGVWSPYLRLVGNCILCKAGYVMGEKNAQGRDCQRTVAAHSNGFCQRCQYIVYSQNKPAIGDLRNRSAAWVYSCRICQRNVPVMLHMYDTAQASAGHLCDVCSSSAGSSKRDAAEQMYKKARIDHEAFTKGGTTASVTPGPLSSLIPASSPNPVRPNVTVPNVDEEAVRAASMMAQAAADMD